MDKKKIKVLLIEDNPGDVRLTKEVLNDGKLAVDLNVAQDGTEAFAFLRRQGKYADAPRPDLILLDLNLPKKNGREVLTEIKDDNNLKRIPVVILTSSEADKDIEECYNFQANCYTTKPIEPDRFSAIVQIFEDFHFIDNFWFTI